MTGQVKKKIKLVISDFHLGNGQFLQDGAVNLLEDFIHDAKFIEFIEYYGNFGDDADVELIINGDFFNMIQLMPEEQPNGILTQRAAVGKISSIIKGHQKIFDALRLFNSKPFRRIIFIMGNHDPGLLWPSVQEVLKKNIQGEMVFIDDVYRIDGMHIEHGHQLETIFRFDKTRYFLTVGFDEPVLNLPWGVFFVKDFLYGLKKKRPYIDKVKPYNRYLRWAFFNDFWYGFFGLLRYVGFVIRCRFSKLPLKKSQSLMGLHAGWAATQSPTLVEDARKITQKENCRIVVLGHTHIPVHKSFNKDQEYLNPGCWNDVTSLDLSSLGHTLRLIYVLIEYRQNRPYARLVEWHGQHRIWEEVRA